MTFFGGNPWLNRPFVECHCIFCGHSFQSKMKNALHCSHNCATKTFRARSKLAGTHTSIRSRWTRIKKEVDAHIPLVTRDLKEEIPTHATAQYETNTTTNAGQERRRGTTQSAAPADAR